MNNRLNKPPQSETNPSKKRVVIILSMLTVCLALALLAIRPSVTPPPEPPSQLQIIESLRTKIDVLADRLLTDFPNDPRLTKTAIRYNRQCNNSSKAMTILEQAINSNPANFEFCDMAAEIALNNGMFEEAIVYANKALAIKPENLQLNEDIANALISLGKYQEAVNQLEANINIAKPSVQTHYLLAQGYSQMKEFDKARINFEKTLTMDPSHHQANYGLAKVYLKTKQRDKAKKYMDLYNKYKSGKIDQMQGWAGKYEDIVTDKSITDIKTFMTVFSNMSLRGNELYKTRNDTKNTEKIVTACEKTYSEIITYVPDQPVLYHNFALFYINTSKMPTKAVPLAQKAVELDNSAKNYYMLARTYFHTANKKDALSAIKKAVELDNNKANYKRLHTLIERMR